MFKLQDEVVTRLARSLGVALAIAEAEKGAHSKNPDAVDLTMRAFELNSTMPERIPRFLLYVPRAIAENSLGRFEQAKADAEQAIRLSPRDPAIGTFHVIVGDAEISLGHFDAAIVAYRKATDLGFHVFFAYSNLSAAYVHAGKMDEAKAALAEARRLNPAITVKWMKEHTPNLPAVFDGLRKAGLPRGMSEPPKLAVFRGARRWPDASG